MPQFRQLAAIMFTDIVGYTALMGEDEQKAFVLLNKNRQLQTGSSFIPHTLLHSYEMFAMNARTHCMPE